MFAQRVLGLLHNKPIPSSNLRIGPVVKLPSHKGRNRNKAPRPWLTIAIYMWMKIVKTYRLLQRWCSLGFFPTLRSTPLETLPTIPSESDATAWPGRARTLVIAPREACCLLVASRRTLERREQTKKDEFSQSIDIYQHPRR